MESQPNRSISPTSSMAQCSQCDKTKTELNILSAEYKNLRQNFIKLKAESSVKVEGQKQHIIRLQSNVNKMKPIQIQAFQKQQLVESQKELIKILRQENYLAQKEIKSLKEKEASSEFGGLKCEIKHLISKTAEWLEMDSGKFDEGFRSEFIEHVNNAYSEFLLERVRREIKVECTDPTIENGDSNAGSEDQPKVKMEEMDFSCGGEKSIIILSSPNDNATDPLELTSSIHQNGAGHLERQSVGFGVDPAFENSNSNNVDEPTPNIKIEEPDLEPEVLENNDHSIFGTSNDASNSLSDESTSNTDDMNANNSVEQFFRVSAPNFFECVYCDYSCNHKHTMTRHARIHTGEKPYRCNICSKSFTRTSTLNRHKLQHAGIKPYKCDECSKSFSEKSHLTRHIRSHTGDKPYKCDVCLREFTDPSSMATHMRVHTGERPYKCDICPAEFSSSSNLMRHKGIHTGIKTYKCDICSSKFTASGDLTVHKRSHTGERPYKCNSCPKEFSKSSDLTIHKRIHAGLKPHKCDICTKEFTKSSNLIRHQRLHTRD